MIARLEMHHTHYLFSACSCACNKQRVVSELNACSDKRTRTYHELVNRSVCGTHGLAFERGRVNSISLQRQF